MENKSVSSVPPQSLLKLLPQGSGPGLTWWFNLCSKESLSTPDRFGSMFYHSHKKQSKAACLWWSTSFSRAPPPKGSTQPPEVASFTREYAWETQAWGTFLIQKLLRSKPKSFYTRWTLTLLIPVASPSSKWQLSYKNSGYDTRILPCSEGFPLAFPFSSRRSGDTDGIVTRVLQMRKLMWHVTLQTEQTVMMERGWNSCTGLVLVPVLLLWQTHDQEQLREDFTWAYSPRGRRGHHGGEKWQQAAA